MIRQAERGDKEELLHLALKLWPESDRTELKNEFDMFIASDDNAVFIVQVNSETAGFAHCSLRHDYVAGAESSPVGYLEGIYVSDGHRFKGYARQLVEACESWSKKRGCSDFGSDCLIDNSASIEMHAHLGFREVERIVSFHKRLT
ncbi:aminoglycoside 6'-N-acetyltransferase [Salinicoccus bachuensis]|uniref:Aminoglycoside N(6')-acetyltransferase type 1 n=1 Tax=Salinicoccus bachuensis TaxID=3136731 RepID=A0ABZ3CLT6_9STAP